MNEKLKIIHFSLDRFIKLGFHKTTMDQIAREMHISKKTIYKHFKNKDELIRASVEYITGGVKKSVEQIITSEDNSVKKLNSIGKVLLNVALRITDNWLYDLKVHYFFIWEEMERFRSKTINENFRKIIEQGKREGYIVNCSTNLILAVIRSGIQAVINPEFLINNSLSAQEAGKETLNIVFSGIFTKQGRKHYKQLKLEK